MKRFFVTALAISFVAAPVGTVAAPRSSPAQQLMSKLHWRSIGPYIGGRVVAVAGVPSKPDLFYMGGVEGGVWKSTDYGQNWTNITDGKIPGIADPIGALAVADSNKNVIYAGTGESDIRGDFDTGDGGDQFVQLARVPPLRAEDEGGVLAGGAGVAGQVRPPPWPIEFRKSDAQPTECRPRRCRRVRRITNRVRPLGTADVVRPALDSIG